MFNHDFRYETQCINWVQDAQYQFQPCRVLLDSGAEASLISESCAKRLNLKRTCVNIPIKGINSENQCNSNGYVNLIIKSKFNSYRISTNALVLPTLCNFIPSFEIDSHNINNIRCLQLADERFDQPGSIDIVIGSDLFFNVLLKGRYYLNNSLVAQNTIFGFVVAGKVINNQADQRRICHVNVEINELLQKFWNIEELNNRKIHLSEQEIQCETEFKNKHYRDSSGRYVVSLPFKSDLLLLGESKPATIYSLKMLENRFKRDPNLRDQYVQFMDEYLQLGHMKLVTDKKQIADQYTYYIPHHAVYKESSTTTKLRVVFNASKATSTGISLNDKLLVGPTVQDDLTSILMRFRTHKYALTADIAKMYRQIRVDEKDTKFQRICWRTSTFDPILEYELLTVTYGTACAPYLATKTLNQLAADEQNNFPIASDIVQNSFYVDDLMTGAESVETASELAIQLLDLLKSGGFELRKWASNSREVLINIPESARELEISRSINELEDTTIKTLGLSWNIEGDYFFFSPILPDITSFTIRSILSTIAKIFDPMGWIAPCVIKTKIIMQKLWMSSVDWDDELPQHILVEWLEFYNDLNNISQLKIPRWVPFISQKLELHIFSDASEKAYAAVAYLRIHGTNDEVSVHLLASKTRVAPIKQVRLPRLELCAAHLASKLAQKIQNSFKCQNLRTFAWTDSQIVLAWLSDHPRRWTTFVANRTSEILSIIARPQWHHITSKANPADSASRGINASNLRDLNLWWRGPDLLWNESIDKWLQPSTILNTNEEERKTVLMTTISSSDIISRFSSFFKLRRIIALCMRFITNCRVSKENRTYDYISVKELNLAANILYKIAQHESFAEEIELINQNKPLPNKNKLAAYVPFLDEQGVLRVGGRLNESNLQFNQRHPVILSKNHPLTELIVRDYHLIHLHAGQRLLSCLISLNYFIIGNKSLIKQIIYKCVKCIRYKAQVQQQLMGNLPSVRVTPARPFQHCGVDYAGPLNVRSWKGRGAKTYKAYISLFICLSTKAFHLELVKGLSTDDFIAAFKRFCARRGLCQTIYSDNGTTFIGANRHFKELGELLKSKSHQYMVTKYASEKTIEWKFIPPSAPHFGGIWESGVKLVKHHLRRQMGNALLTFEETSTLLCQIEALINSRPIAVNPDADEPELLTPAHFLIGSNLNSVPEEDTRNTSISPLKRWNYVQKLHQSFWRNWNLQYLIQLQRRNKWKTMSKNLKLDDVVLIKEDTLPPGAWAMGKVMALHPGKDNIVRVVTVKTKSGHFKRPIHKLILMTKDNY